MELSCRLSTLAQLGTCFLGRMLKMASATPLNASISSSTVPPMPMLSRLMEFVTYTGSCVLRATSFATRVVNSRDDSAEKSVVAMACCWLNLWF